MRGEKVISSALPCLRKDGTVFYADIAGNSTIINERKCSVGFFVDVTTRKQTEDAGTPKQERTGQSVQGLAGDDKFHWVRRLFQTIESGMDEDARISDG